MKIVNDSLDSGTVLIKIKEEEVNALLMNYDYVRDKEGELKYIYDEFINSVVDNIPEFAGYDSSLNSETKIVRDSAKAMLRLKNVLKIKEYFDNDMDESEWDEDVLKYYYSKGVFGELIFHFILKELLGTFPLISKLYFKDSIDFEAHGYDLVHVKNEDTLMLGEAKFYRKNAWKRAIDELLEDIKDHFTKDFLDEQFVIIGKNLESMGDEKRKKWIKKLSSTKTLREAFQFIEVPLFCLYESSIVKAESLSNEDEFNKKYLAHISEVVNHYNTNKKNRNIKVVLILFPVESKKKIVKLILERIFYMQKI